MATLPSHSPEPRPLRKSNAGRAAFLASLLAIVMIMVGWRSALALDSALLGFCVALLAMILGAAIYGALQAPQRRGYR